MDIDVTQAELEAVDVFLATGKNAEALKLMRSLFARAPENPKVLNGIMLALYLNGRYREAIKMFEEAPPEVSSTAWTLNTASINYVSLGKFVAAEQTIERALQLDPNNPEYLLNDAIAKTNLRKFDIGEQKIRRFIEAHPNDARGYQSMADLILRRPLYGTAEENFGKMVYYIEKSFQLDPVRFRGRKMLAVCYFALKKYDKWVQTLIGKWPVKESKL